MGKSAATRQLEQAGRDKSRFLGEINSFQYGQQQQGLDNPFADVGNPFAGLTNTAASQRVATGAAEFQAQRQDVQTANLLDALVQGGGGSGAGATATALAQQAAQSNQAIAAGLEQQEASINQQVAAQAAQNQQLEAQGAARQQELIASGRQYVLGLSEARDAGELAGLGNLYAGAQQSSNAAIQAKAQSKAAIIGGITKLAGAALTAPLKGGGSLIGNILGG